VEKEAIKCSAHLRLLFKKINSILEIFTSLFEFSIIHLAVLLENASHFKLHGKEDIIYANKNIISAEA
jgi:hypothetical protein